MKKHLLIAASLFTSHATFANQPIELGMWNNVNPDTQGVTRLKIEENNDTHIIQAWGSCSPVDCEWEPTTLHFLSTPPSPTLIGEAIARWDNDFSKRTFVFKPEGEKLIVESYVVFTDDSDRRPYKQTAIFMRR
ncbi:hypothetical protein EK599_06155 [Vibrio sp. T187]|uniref:hypothetical protein n=1 Tax=Vibrio TaxID=662 RepID=UPI0010C98D32|nr:MULTISPECIES: hypothetical protein [Vibrio]MBW3695268.1 hypothetical protein [Vibrio sp. T187]